MIEIKNPVVFSDEFINKPFIDVLETIGNLTETDGCSYLQLPFIFKKEGKIITSYMYNCEQSVAAMAAFETYEKMMSEL